MKSTFPLIIALFGLVLLGSCKNGVNVMSANDALGGVEVGDSLFMVFERTPCFGKCPAFRVHLYKNGYATYEGIQFAPQMGMHSGVLAPEIVLEIQAEAERTGFWGFEAKYDGPVTDLPSMIIDLRTKEKSHKIFARYGTPKALKAFGTYLDKVVNMAEWNAIESSKE